MKSLILAGGYEKDSGKDDLPMPMAMIAGKPFLEHQLNFLRDQGLEEVVLCVSYESEAIKSYFGDGGRFGLNLSYSEEETNLGTAGAIKKAGRYLDETFLAIQGVSYVDFDVSKFLNFHKSNKGGLASLLLSNGDNPDSLKVSLEAESGRIISLSNNGEGNSLVGSGVYLFEPEILKYIPKGRNVSLKRETLPQIVSEERLFGIVNDGYFMDIRRPETYHQFKSDFLKRMQIREGISVRDALKVTTKNKMDVLFVVDENEKVLGVLTDNIMRKFIVDGGNLEQDVSSAMVKGLSRYGKVGDDEDEILKLVYSTRHLPILDEEGRIKDIRFHSDETARKSFPTVRGKAPLRISFAGGGTDMPYYFEENGGVVINSTIDKYCHATAKKRADSTVIVQSDMLDEEVVFNTKKIEYNGEFDILKSIFNVVNPGFGAEFYLGNDLPPGRGLGSSASFSVLIAKILGDLQGIRYDEETLAEIAYRAEVEELGIIGGKQDQYAAVFGGFNWIEFEKGDKKIMNSLRVKRDTIDELQAHLLLCYTGATHSSSVQHTEQEKSFRMNEEVRERLQKMKGTASEIRRNLLSVKPSFEKIGELLHYSWEDKKKLSSKVSNGRIDELYETGRSSGVYGGKLLGSGGGGYLLFLHPPKVRHKLISALEEKGGEILPFNFEKYGVRTWTV